MTDPTQAVPTPGYRQAGARGERVKVGGQAVSGGAFVFTQFPDLSFSEFFGLSKRQRVGVPGAASFNPVSVYSLARFTGTSFQATLASGIFWLHLVLLAFLLFLHSELADAATLRGMRPPNEFSGLLSNIAIFTIAVFAGNCYSRFDERFHDCCKVNHAVAAVGTMATGWMGGHTASGSELAASITRYSCSLVHVLYLNITGPMDERKWAHLWSCGMLTREEVDILQDTRAPELVLHQWMARLLHRACDHCIISHEQLANIDEAVGTARELASKQRAYTVTQVPLVYFHIMSLCLHSWLFVSSWQAASDARDAYERGCAAPAGGGPEQCYRGLVFVLVGAQVAVVYLFIGLYTAAVWMADPMGTRASNYDLGHDLEQMWEQALTCIHSMTTGAYEPPVTELHSTADGFKFQCTGRRFEPPTEFVRRHSLVGTTAEPAAADMRGALQVAAEERLVDKSAPATAGSYQCLRTKMGEWHAVQIVILSASASGDNNLLTNTMVEYFAWRRVSNCK
eukprot:g6709.t1